MKDLIWEYIGLVKFSESTHGEGISLYTLDKLRSELHIKICECLKKEYGVNLRTCLRITKQYFHSLDEFKYDADWIIKR